MTSFTTNLGNIGQANYLIAETQVRSPAFSQPEIVVGSATTPVSTSTVAYVAGFTKYVFYFTLTTATGINEVFDITGMPSNFMATNSSFAQVVAVASTSFSTPPIISVAHQYFNNGTPTYNANPISSTSPVFSTGTAYLKVIIQFTLD